MDLVRGLLGDAKLNFLGVSYGTWIGAWYASLFPERVGRMLLDSSMDVTGNYDDATLLQEMGHQRVINEIILPYAARHSKRFNLDSNASQTRDAVLALPPLLKTLLVTDSINVNNSANFDQNPLNITAAFGLNALRQKMPLAEEPGMHAAIDTYAFTTGADNLIAAALAHELAKKAFKKQVRSSVFLCKRPANTP